jgi:uncharacterized protein YndB with AHSA1/START domain
MNTAPLIVERTLQARPEQVWHALTDKAAMKAWYFDVDAFEPVPGFEFRFTGGTEEKSYLHICVIDEVVPLQKLSYSWRYDTFPGNSKVSFELFPEGDGTRVKVTHEGLHHFPDLPDFVRSNFEKGWTDLLDVTLRRYLQSS